MTGSPSTLMTTTLLSGSLGKFRIITKLKMLCSCDNFCDFSSLSSVASWTLTPPSDATGWRHIRVRINGPNASGQSHYLSLSGLEIYGEVRGLADEDLGKFKIRDDVNTFEITYWYGIKIRYYSFPFQARQLVRLRQPSRNSASSFASM